MKTSTALVNLVDPTSRLTTRNSVRKMLNRVRQNIESEPPLDIDYGTIRSSADSYQQCTWRLLF